MWNNGHPDRVRICSESLMFCKLEKNSWVGWFGKRKKLGSLKWKAVVERQNLKSLGLS